MSARTDALRHLSARKPAQGTPFAWARNANDEQVLYRLFRRDHRRAVHQYTVGRRADAPRELLAQDLRRARRALRDKVDEIDLKAMGVTA